MDDLLQTLTRYHDVAPRSVLRAEPLGSFVLFFSEEPLGWRYCARPALGAGSIEPGDLAAVRARQRDLGIPEVFEWIEETTPWMGAVMAAAGMAVVSHPLMVLAPKVELPAVELTGIELSLVHAGDPDLARIGAVANVAFASPDPAAAGAPGLEALEAARAERDPATVEIERRHLRSGVIVRAVARIEGVPVATGGVQPFEDVANIVGVATLPAFQRRGLGQAISALLVRHALGQGARVVSLTAASNDVARMYAGVGFRRVGSSCMAIGATLPV
jgi:ribosomal protein S18 acetylase RimI-like enzyme